MDQNPPNDLPLPSSAVVKFAPNISRDDPLAGTHSVNRGPESHHRLWGTSSLMSLHGPPQNVKSLGHIHGKGVNMTADMNTGVVPITLLPLFPLQAGS